MSLRASLALRWSAFQRRRRRRGWVIRLRVNTPTARLFLVLLATLALLSGALGFALSYLSAPAAGTHLSISQLEQLAANGQVITARLNDFDHRVLGTFVPAAAARTPRPQPVQFWADYPASDAETPVLIDQLVRGGAATDVQHQVDKALIQFLAQYLLPLVMLANLFGLIFIATRGGGGGIGGIVQFGRLGARNRSGSTGTSFADVAGADAALAEMREVRDYLRDPGRFAAVGAQPPKGVMLFGPPGCGKTLLSRAVAGEAGVPFFSISGAEFVESLVGVGAARVRDLFRQVREVAPAIVFIDEIDAVGRRRGGVTGGQEERDQTLNQLLIEVDGFESSSGIVIIGATNRPDILDPALLRPGRFDRQITVEPPDAAGRAAILELHAQGRPMVETVDWTSIAQRTPGFTGADLANVVNEASLLAVRDGRVEIGFDDVSEAVQRVIAGPQRRGHLLTVAERRRAAYHESGHAVIAAALGRSGDIHRLSLVARSRSLATTTAARIWAERELLTHAELHQEMVCTLGGAAAEDLVFGELTTGSEDDIDRATAVAELMVGRYGMSERLGKVRLVRTEGAVFLGATTVPTELSTGPVLERLYEEVRRLVDDAESRARALLVEHRPTLDRLAGALLDAESLEGVELSVALAGVAG